MNVLHTVFLLAGLITVTASIRCFCSDETYCMSGLGPEEDCADHLTLEYLERNSVKLKYELILSLVSLLSLRTQLESKNLSDPLDNLDELFDIQQNATDVVNSLSPGETITMIELVKEIYVYYSQLVHNMNEMQLSNTMLPKIDAILAGKATPSPVDYQFCVHLIDAGGELKQSCGIISSDIIGVGLQQGCHVLAERDTIYTNYCRCEKDLCNEGDITIKNESPNSGKVETIPSVLISTTLLFLCALA